MGSRNGNGRFVKQFEKLGQDIRFTFEDRKSRDGLYGSSIYLRYGAMSLKDCI